MTKRAFITGITGQDGAYLADLLLDKGYEVHGLLRRNSTDSTERIRNHLDKIHLHYGDLTDASNLIRLIKEIDPEEIYNLAAMSDVAVSFDSPEYTANVDALGTLRLLEAIRISGLEGKTRFYQASTSELFGNVTITPQNEATPFHPASPYACAKLYAYWTTVMYRNAYGIHANNGILFNHESPVRGDDFVTQKICKGVAAIRRGEQSTLSLGNLNAMRDWGHARDYVSGMWLMIQAEKADDYVLATGESWSVRAFVERAFAHIDVRLDWQGQGTDEVGLDSRTGQTLVTIDPNLHRPIDVHHLCGDATKAQTQLGWRPTVTFDELITEMMNAVLE